MASTLRFDNWEDSNGTPILDGSNLAIPSSAMPAGSVLQVVSTIKTNTYSESIAGSTISSNVVTGLTTAITPVATSSRIKIEVSTFLSNSTEDGNSGFVVRRDSTAIGVGDEDGDRSRLSAFGGAYQNYSGDMVGLSFTLVDSPSSTSEITYGISLYNRNPSTASTHMNRTSVDQDFSYRPRTVSTITLTEVAG